MLTVRLETALIFLNSFYFGGDLTERSSKMKVKIARRRELEGV